MKFVRLVFLFALLGCAHRNPVRLRLDDLQTLTTASLPTDSAVLARLSREHPCVTRVPRLSAFSDAFSKPVACTLVETAIAAIRELNAAPEVLDDLREFRVGRVLCATLKQEAYRNEVTGTIDVAHWTIQFDSDEQPSVMVEIHRRTGQAQAIKALNEFDLTAEDLCQ